MDPSMWIWFYCQNLRKKTRILNKEYQGFIVSIKENWKRILFESLERISINEKLCHFSHRNEWMHCSTPLLHNLVHGWCFRDARMITLRDFLLFWILWLLTLLSDHRSARCVINSFYVIFFFHFHLCFPIQTMHSWCELKFLFSELFNVCFYMCV